MHPQLRFYPLHLFLRHLVLLSCFLLCPSNLAAPFSVALYLEKCLKASISRIIWAGQCPSLFILPIFITTRGTTLSHRRCVIVVGLPFPNAKEPLMKERLEFVSGDRTVFLENMCMKAVNQCIGRAIRHAGDYACIVLVDQRYGTQMRIQDKLPGWLRNRLSVTSSFGDMFKQVVGFFRTRKA